MRWRKRENTAKGLAAGLIGGLFASWVMNQFQAALYKLKERTRHDDGKSAGAPPAAAQRRPRQSDVSEDERANERVAVLVAENVLHQQIRHEEKETAGEIVHYAYGTLVGGVYGVGAEKFAAARSGAGLAFGAGLWFLSDEIGVPALGLSKPPQEYSFSVHASALASHLVYGVTTELVRRALRSGFLAD